VKIPYKFKDAGRYSIKVAGYGIPFTPIKPESA
jgi:hypothetical protein